MDKEKYTPLIEQNCWRHIGVWGKQFPRCERLAEFTHCRNCDVFAEAARRIFHNNNSDTELLQRSRAIYDDAKNEILKGEFSALPFRIGPHWMCVPTDNVIVVAENVRVHSLPYRSSDVLRGLVAINGEIFTCVCLTNMLGLPRSAMDSIRVKGAFERIVTIRLAQKRVAFRVDEVQNIIRFNRENQHEVDLQTDMAEYFDSEIEIKSDYLQKALMLNLNSVENVFRAVLV